MLFILCEKTILSICSGLDRFYDKFPEGTRIFCTADFFKNLNTQSYNQPPLLANRWLIICAIKHVRNNASALVELSNKNIVIITTEEWEDVVASEELFRKWKITPKIIDNRVPTKSEVYKFIGDNINAESDDVIEYIYNRHHGYIPNIIKSVHTLSLVDNVTKSIVRKYTAPAADRNLNDLASWLIGQQKDFVTYEDVVRVVYNYRFGMAFLLKYLLDYVDTYLAVFEEISMGNLDAKNAQEFLSTCKHKLIKTLSHKRLLVIIDTYSKVSVDKLMLVRHFLKNITANSYNTYKLLNLLKITG